MPERFYALACMNAKADTGGASALLVLLLVDELDAGCFERASNNINGGERPMRRRGLIPALLIATLTGVLIALGTIAVTCLGNAAAPVDWSSAERMELRMVEYEFVPNQLRFRRGVLYQLHLVNAGKEGHDFTAPDFLASVEVKNIDALNDSRTSVFLNPGEATDIYFIASNVGLFAPRCADHDWAGMKATVVVD
jgi:uncharacterized cupredoxin-like copper-binding protein